MSPIIPPSYPHHTPIIPPSYPPGRTDTSSPKGNRQAHTHTHTYTHTSLPFLDIDVQQNTFIHLLSHSYIHKLTHAYSSTHSLHPPLSSSISSPLSPSLSLPPFPASSSSSPPFPSYRLGYLSYFTDEKAEESNAAPIGRLSLTGAIVEVAEAGRSQLSLEEKPEKHPFAFRVLFPWFSLESIDDAEFDADDRGRGRVQSTSRGSGGVGGRVKPSRIKRAMSFSPVSKATKARDAKRGAKWLVLCAKNERERTAWMQVRRGRKRATSSINVLKSYVHINVIVLPAAITAP